MIFQSSGLEFDTNRFVVRKDGKDLSVAPKVFDLLIFLMRHRDRLVTREELFEELWAGRVVSDNVLSNEIKLARAVIGDNGQQQKYIRTARGRGYQFVGEVSEHHSDPLPASNIGSSDSSPAPATDRGLPQRRSFVGLTAILLAVALTSAWFWKPAAPAGGAADALAVAAELRPNTIAILPFANRSNLANDAFFVDGFHDDLITQVTKLSGLTAISRTSVMTYRDSGKSTLTIGRELGSALIIAGGVQRAADQVRINVQMIDVATDKPIWAETYTRQLNAKNVFAVQSEIALAVAGQLQAALSEQERQTFAEVPTNNLAALEEFFRGRISAASITTRGFSDATAHFQESVKLDPDFAEAQAQLGLSLLRGLALLKEGHQSGMNSNDSLALAEVAIEKALSLNPDLSEAYAALAVLELNKGNLAAAESAFRKALELKPGNADALRMYAAFKTWYYREEEEGLELLDSLKLLDPQNPATLTVSSQLLMRLNRIDEAQAMLDVAATIAPDFAETYRLLAELHQVKRYQFDQSIRFFRKYHSMDPQTPRDSFHMAAAYDEIGNYDEAVRLYELVLEWEPNRDLLWVNIARVRLHLARGESAQAERAFADIEARFGGGDAAIDEMLSGFDLALGNPERVIDRIETRHPRLSAYPDAVLADPTVLEDNNQFKLAIVYATALHLVGRNQQAVPLTRLILDNLSAKSRHRWSGIQTLDTWLHVAMRNHDKALQSLRDWRAMGGRLDLTKHRMVPASLFDHPEFQAMNNEILEELAEQRANLARLEASGQIAPLPTLPLSR